MVNTGDYGDYRDFTLTKTNLWIIYIYISRKIPRLYICMHPKVFKVEINNISDNYSKMNSFIKKIILYIMNICFIPNPELINQV